MHVYLETWEVPGNQSNIAINWATQTSYAKVFAHGIQINTLINRATLMVEQVMLGPRGIPFQLINHSAVARYIIFL